MAWSEGAEPGLSDPFILGGTGVQPYTWPVGNEFPSPTGCWDGCQILGSDSLHGGSTSEGLIPLCVLACP